MHLAEQVCRGVNMNQKYITRCLILTTVIVFLMGCVSKNPSSNGEDHRRPPLINNESFTNFVPIDIIEIPTNNLELDLDPVSE